MQKRNDRLVYKFGFIFLNFTIITLVVSFLMTYVSQTDTYRKTCLENSRDLGNYLASLMESEGDAFVAYKEYYLNNYRDIKMSADFTEYISTQGEFLTMFAERYPDSTFGVDKFFDELDADLQAAFFTFNQEYWVLTFEHARDAFGLSYAYFLIMGDQRSRIEDLEEGDDPQYCVLYLIDGERTVKPGTDWLYLGDTYGNNRDEHLLEWMTYENGRTIDDYYEWNNAWGHTYSYYTPLIINGETIGLICTDLEVESVNSIIIRNSLLNMVGIAAALIICTVVMLWFINRFHIRRINQLEAGVLEYTRDKNVGVADRIETLATSGDEIGSLSAQTCSMMREIDRYIKNITDMTAERERFGTELRVATAIQKDMMPRVFPKRNDLEMFALMSPATEVGGDFYDYFFVDSNHIVFVMADVSGKGVPAALFLVIAKTLIKNRAMMGGSPSRILEDVNFSLCESNTQNMFITTWLGILTLSTGKLICTNAGHEYPAIRHKGGKYELIISDHCPPLASMEDLEYEDETIMLEPGDSLFLYTDGVTEAKNSLGKHLGTKKMLEILNAAPDLAPHELLTGLKDLIDDFARGTDTFDDITMMCINYLGYQK